MGQWGEYIFIQKKQYQLGGSPNITKSVTALIKDVFAANCHTYFMVTSSNDVFHVPMNLACLKNQKKHKMPVRCEGDFIDLRYMIVHKQSKEVVRPTPSIMKRLNEGNTLPIE